MLLLWFVWKASLLNNSYLLFTLCLYTHSGLNVLVLEKGGYFRAEEFKSWRESEAFLHAFEKGFFLAILVGMCMWPASKQYALRNNNDFFDLFCSFFSFSGGLCSTVEGNVLVLAGTIFLFCWVFFFCLADHLGCRRVILSYANYLTHPTLCFFYVFAILLQGVVWAGAARSTGAPRCALPQ